MSLLKRLEQCISFLLSIHVLLSYLSVNLKGLIDYKHVEAIKIV